ncbi:hypothetical protein GCM10019016_078180 [Streptomyces prasinosporus]|uniref:Uncharacterized protein n=2 Tax=Streptomyces TaxID=1883 RepID=A0ABP6U330_9ACTN|nr:DUF6308 family protein [Streptomyces tricolor]MCG0061844.1 DUF6308 family protein [Streptomyces tricolor]GHB93706.1 hypothetical protein GCM10010332_19600 [Streptomyces albogriseolus]
MIELKIPEIYWDDEAAVSLLVEYFTRRRSRGDLFYSGAHFERLGGGGDAEHVADSFDSNDLVAITTLSVSLEPHGAMNLLTDPEGHWARLLSLIPRDARLENPGSDALMEEGGPAWELWERLAGTKQYPGKPDGSGPVVAGKLLARKRPRLIPIYDIRIKQLFERPKTDQSFWTALAATLRVDNGAFYDQLVHLRDQAGIGEDIGVLRVFDVVAWMHQGRQGQVARS